MTTNHLLIIGDEEYLHQQTTRKHYQHLTETYGELSHRTTEAETLTPPTLDEHLTPDLTGTHPVLIIKNTNKINPKTLQHITTHYIQDTQCTIIFNINKPTDAGAKATIKTLQQHNLPTHTITTPKTLKEKNVFTKQQLQQHGLTTNYETQTLLTESETDLRGIATRTQQLTHDNPQTRNVTTEHVTTIATNPNTTAFTIANHFINKNLNQTVTTALAALQTGTPPTLIQTATLTTLKDITNIKSGNTNTMPPWKKQKLQTAANLWNQQQLAQAIHHVGNITENIRSNTYTNNTLITNLIQALTP